MAGGGIGGLTLAIALQRAGVEVTVFERAPKLAPVGAGIVLAVNALAVLQRMGVADAIVGTGQVQSTGIIGDAFAGELARSPLSELTRAAGAPMVAFHRAELHEALLGQLAPGTVRLDAGVRSFEERGERVRVTLEHGETVEGDLLVGADGLHSVVRQALVGDGLVHSGQTSWRGITGPLGLLDAGTSLELWGPGRRFGAVSLTGGRVYWFAVADVPASSAPAKRASPQQQHEALLHDYAKWPAPVLQILEATAPEAILQTDLQDREPLPRWSFGRVTLLGDAAHPMTPNLGQGACQAVEDAFVLAEELRAAAGDVTGALLRYQARRIPRTSRIVLASRRFGKVAHWKNPVARFTRNLALRLMPKRATVRQFHGLILADAPLAPTTGRG